MAADTFFRVNSPTVIDEIFDDEVVIINLDSGSYYSVAGTGLAVWQAIKRGAGEAALLATLAARYAGDPAEIEQACRAFLAELRRESLLVPADSAAPTAGAAAEDEPPADRPAFAAPTLQKYNDMQDLLLLDPIHEVDETGWPSAKPEFQQAAK
jgi:hypothetical protein